MMAVNKFMKIIVKASALFLWVLALFISGCEQPEDTVGVGWKDGQAVALTIRRDFIPGFTKDSVNQLQIQLVNSGSPILGEYEIEDAFVVFTPLIPFTRGQKYEVRWSGKIVKQIEIPLDKLLIDPSVVGIYPSGDSLPENLLKMYIVFSKPMR